VDRVFHGCAEFTVNAFRRACVLPVDDFVSPKAGAADFSIARDKLNWNNAFIPSP
jgi:hypothetical protein